MNVKQIEKIFAKTQQMELTYEPLIFRAIGEIPMVLMETREHFRKAPEGDYRPIQKGEIWGGESCTGWFQGEIDGPAGRKLYLSAETGAIETLLFVEDLPKGVFANKVVIRNRGNHHIQLLTDGLAEGQRLHFSLEAYCWHNVPGNQPFSVAESGARKACFSGVYLCEMEETVKDFVFDLRTLNQLAELCPTNSAGRKWKTAWWRSTGLSRRNRKNTRGKPCWTACEMPGRRWRRSWPHRTPPRPLSPR